MTKEQTNLERRERQAANVLDAERAARADIEAAQRRMDVEDLSVDEYLEAARDLAVARSVCDVLSVKRSGINNALRASKKLMKRSNTFGQ